MGHGSGMDSGEEIRRRKVEEREALCSHRELTGGDLLMWVDADVAS